MPALFASLSRGGNGNNGDTNTSSSLSSISSSSPAFPPTVVQLYSSHYVHFGCNNIVPVISQNDNNNNNNNNIISNNNTSCTTSPTGKNKYHATNAMIAAPPRPFEALSYQAVEVDDDTKSVSASGVNSGGILAARKMQQRSPNLGVWDCRVLPNRRTSTTTTTTSGGGSGNDNLDKDGNTTASVITVDNKDWNDPAVRAALLLRGTSSTNNRRRGEETKEDTNEKSSGAFSKSGREKSQLSIPFPLLLQ